MGGPHVALRGFPSPLPQWPEPYGEGAVRAEAAGRPLFSAKSTNSHKGSDIASPCSAQCRYRAQAPTERQKRGKAQRPWRQLAEEHRLVGLTRAAASVAAAVTAAFAAVLGGGILSSKAATSQDIRCDAQLSVGLRNVTLDDFTRSPTH